MSKMSDIKKELLVYLSLIKQDQMDKDKQSITIQEMEEYINSIYKDKQFPHLFFNCSKRDHDKKRYCNRCGITIVAPDPYFNWQLIENVKDEDLKYTDKYETVCVSCITKEELETTDAGKYYKNVWLDKNKEVQKIEDKIIELIKTKPGLNARRIRDYIGINNAKLLNILNNLTKQNKIFIKENGNKKLYYILTEEIKVWN